MADRELWVDLNDVDSELRVSALLRFADVPRAYSPGEWVMVGDDDGNRAVAFVESVHDGVVELKVSADQVYSAAE